ncbi:MAG: NUDIX domain-containing protein [Planctomycetes bacterium]|nr:NUDIX domain-containing protein [Planctomycetota bacterium]
MNARRRAGGATPRDGATNATPRKASRSGAAGRGASGGASSGASGFTDIVVAVVRDGDEVLVTRRSAGAHLGGFDEFPGGKREGDESLEAACVREVLEETGVAIEVVKLLAVSWFDGDGRRLALSFFTCRPTGERAPSVEAEQRRAARWIARRELANLRFPPANAAVVAQLLAEAPAS